jgi:cytochrome b involved in lipid metabolism
MSELAKVRFSTTPFQLLSSPLIGPCATLKHNTPEDAWSAFNGRVYSLNAYLRFHPGGEKELMRVAGRDGTKLFSECMFLSLFQWKNSSSRFLTALLSR